MESYILEIHSNEDFDLIENEEEREEMQEAYEDEIEAVYQYLKENKINCVNWEQIDDYRFNIDVDTYKDRFNDDVINAYLGDIEALLQIDDIAFITLENHKYI
jgi:hypothetical protein